LPILRRLSAVAALIAFGTLLALGMLEGALRAYDAAKPRPPVARGEFWKQERGYGWLHHPGLEAPWFDDHGEYSLTVKMNSRGLRDVEHDYAKPPGVFRILLLGDSYMEGMQVRAEEIFPRVLEKALANRGRRVEVINASAAEWGTDNELVWLREEGWKYSPDLVLLAFTTANDVRNNSVDLNLRVPSPNPYKPTFTLAPDGGLLFHPMPELPPPPPPVPWWQHLRTGVFFANRLGISLAPPPPPPPADTVAKPLPPLSKVPTDMLVYASPPFQQVENAWLVTRALILEVQKAAQQRGARFAMFSVDGPWAHYDDYWRLMTMYDKTAQETWNRRTPNDTLASFVKEKGIAAVDLFDELEARKTAEPLYYRFDPHWTAAGHRVAADAVARFLVEGDLVPAPQQQDEGTGKQR
jgi:hypothetical protein